MGELGCVWVGGNCLSHENRCYHFTSRSGDLTGTNSSNAPQGPGYIVNGVECSERQVTGIESIRQA